MGGDRNKECPCKCKELQNNYITQKKRDQWKESGLVVVKQFQTIIINKPIGFVTENVNRIFEKSKTGKTEIKDF